MLDLNQFKAFLFDVDRTLVNASYQFPLGVVTIINKLYQQGFEVGICTGRSFQSVRHSVLPVFDGLNHKGYHVISGGAEVINTRGEVFFQKPISPDIVKKLHTDVKRQGRFVAASYNTLFMDKKHLTQYQGAWDIPLASFAEYQNEPITLIDIHEVDFEDECFKSLQDQITIKQMTSNKGRPYVAITAKDVTKATGLKHWAQLSQINLDSVIGFGDSANDIEFLQAVGYGVAMGNAVSELKKVADEVIGSIDENGLKVYLEKLLADNKI